MSLGYVIGESKPTFVTALTSRPLSVGEYIIIDTDDVILVCAHDRAQDVKLIVEQLQGEGRTEFL